MFQAALHVCHSFFISDFLFSCNGSKTFRANLECDIRSFRNIVQRNRKIWLCNCHPMTSQRLNWKFWNSENKLALSFWCTRQFFYLVIDLNSSFLCLGKWQCMIIPLKQKKLKTLLFFLVLRKANNSKHLHTGIFFGRGNVDFTDK